jgi:hypothetical protein
MLSIYQRWVSCDGKAVDSKSLDTSCFVFLPESLLLLEVLSNVKGF